MLNMEEKEKLQILISVFGKLEEKQKDYVHELTCKLSDIHGKKIDMDSNGEISMNCKCK